MALFQIKSRFDARALFELECGSLKLCVEAAIAKRADLGGAYLRGADLGGADLGGADLRGAYLRGAYLRGAYLGGAYLGGAGLGGAYLRGAYLGGADLRGAYLGGADLRGAYLGGADLRGAYLGGADLRAADLRGAYLGGADLGEYGKLVGERPVLQIGPIGSRSDYLIAFLTEKGVVIRAGCFVGPLDQFWARVCQKAPDDPHRREYGAAVVLIRTHAELWMPGAEVVASKRLAAAE